MAAPIETTSSKSRRKLSKKNRRVYLKDLEGTYSYVSAVDGSMMLVLIDCYNTPPSYGDACLYAEALEGSINPVTGVLKMDTEPIYEYTPDQPTVCIDFGPIQDNGNVLLTGNTCNLPVRTASIEVEPISYSLAMIKKEDEYGEYHEYECYKMEDVSVDRRRLQRRHRKLIKGGTARIIAASIGAGGAIGAATINYCARYYNC